MFDHDRFINDVLRAKTPFDSNKLTDRQIVSNGVMAFACKVLSEENPSQERRRSAQHAVQALLDWRFRDAVAALILANPQPTTLA